jgi:Ca-activated chloride channel homolog
LVCFSEKPTPEAKSIWCHPELVEAWRFGDLKISTSSADHTVDVRLKFGSGKNFLCLLCKNKNPVHPVANWLFMKTKIWLPLLMLVFVILAFRKKESFPVKGNITDTNGAAISGVSVMEKGTHNGTTADAKGNYAIKLSSKNAKLVFSAVGYEAKEMKVNGRSVVNVVLNAATTALQEVVVVGYETMAKRDMAYAVPSLQGRAPGVHIRGNSGSYQPQGFNTEDYDKINENGFHKATDDPLSTFSIDVDAASYSNVRRFLNSDQLPPAGAVRTEELINYFRYSYPQPKDEHPFSITTEMTACPWNAQHQLVLIGLQGKQIPMENLPPSNLVFLIDVSGSMQDENKLPLVKSSLKLLVDQLREEDKISIVVYAGAAGLVLPPTSGQQKIKIKEALEALQAGGSTAGGAGIQLAYKTAKENFQKDGNNRVILCTDGDFNVGMSSDDELVRLIEKERASGVFLTVLGYGMGNYKDNKMQQLADKGNGNHAYIDGISEAKKVLVNEFGGTLFTIAKDVKLQVEFNPAKVQGYRLIGYENRMLNKEDFNDDKKDAGELGSGHTVTALYELIPAGVKSPFLKDVDALKYQKENKPPIASYSNEVLTVKFRYKKPDGDKSQLLQAVVEDKAVAFNSASENLRFAAAVAQFGTLLRNSEFKASASFNQVYQTAKAATGKDEEGYRKEFLTLVRKASKLYSKVVEEEEGEDVVLKN